MLIGLRVPQKKELALLMPGAFNPPGSAAAGAAADEATPTALKRSLERANDVPQRACTSLIDRGATRQ